MPTHYKTNWTCDACGCTAPTDVYVYTSGPQAGRAVAVYGTEPDAPYATLDALLEAHSGGELTSAQLRARLRETGTQEAPDWHEIVARARSYYGPQAVRGLQ
jgi:hypothetical protein